MNIRENLEENIEIYAGMTIQKRAIVDVRDCLKPSARLSIYSQYIDKLFPNKPFEKSAVSVASAMKHFYPYGDAALYSMLARMGKPYAMRYKLEDFQGSTGDITEDDNQAAMRYTNMRLSKLAMYLFQDVEKNTIDKWFNSYTDKEQYPSVLPTKGYYNIVNGSMGLAYAIAASIPQFNLKEVNEAMIKLLQNPKISDNEIICMPDFATGGNLINANEVKESLKNGHGSACKLRANVEFDEKEKALIFTNTPYSVYTSTITEQIQKIKLSDDNPGIERVLDQSTNDAYIKVLLAKTANPNKVIKFLFKNTSLQNHYGINLIMLDKGKTPKLFTWKEALQAHIDHEKEVYRRGFEFDLKKILHRIMIIEGLLKAIDAIDEVIATIKASTSTAAASMALQQLLNINEEQAKAILDIKLSRLAKLEITKLVNEKENLEKEANRIDNILKDAELFNNELIKGWKEVAEKFGDERRTRILNIESESDEPTEIKNLIINVTNKNNLFIEEASALYTTRRRSVGTKFKLDKDEYVISASNIQTNDTLLFFTTDGMYYATAASELPYEKKTYIESIIPLKEKAQVCACTSYNLKDEKQFIIFLTKKGYLKKTALSEYNTKRKGGIIALGLEPDDKIVSVLFTNENKIGILTKNSHFLICETKDINPIGRTAKGVKGIKLDDNDYVVAAKLIPNNFTTIVSITTKGKIKQISSTECITSGRYTKGSKIHKLEDDFAADFLPIINEQDFIVCSNKTQTKLSLSEVPLLSKTAAGVQSLKFTNGQKIIQLVQS